MQYAIAPVVLLVIILALLLKTFGINQEYERAVLFRLGRLGVTKGPGWYWLIPFIDRVVKVDTRTITVQLETHRDHHLRRGRGQGQCRFVVPSH